MTITGIFVQILRLWPCLLAFSLAILNFAASCAYGIPEQELNIMYARIGQSEMKLSKEIQYHTQTTCESDRNFLTPLHIKLGLFKQCVKALDKESSAFAYLAEKFPSLSQAKIKEGIFMGPQIRKIVLDETFITHLKRKEKLAFESFKKIYNNFLGNHRSEDYVQVVNDLLSHYHDMGCNMSLKVHVLHSHLDFFGRKS